MGERVLPGGDRGAAGDGAATRAATVRTTIAILLATALLRLPFLGDAHIQIDETFYLTFAERWAGGAIPYVDVWDRKPIGLFLIYRLALWLGGGARGAIIAYQLLALVVVAATALLLAGLARRRDRLAAGNGADIAALAAGLLYPAGLLALQGSGGQATVFTNLLVTAAAALLARAWQRPANPAAPILGAMLLLGLALQVKYTAVFEAAVLGVAALVMLGARGRGIARLAGMALAMAAAGLLPTLAAAAGFALVGALQPFLAANFATFGGKIGASAMPPPLALLLVLPMLLLAGAGWRRDAMGIVLLAWAMAALAGALLLRLPAEHYLQPLLPPLVVLAAAGAAATSHIPMAARRYALAAVLGLTVVAGITATVIRVRNDGGFYLSYDIADAIVPELHGRCLFVVDTFPLLYALTHACAPTAYLFPTHLTRADEIASIGIDAHAELARVLASRPSVIVIANPRQGYMEPRAAAMIEATLAKHYRLGRQFDYDKGQYQLFYARD